jgi:hypothetical protein
LKENWSNLEEALAHLNESEVIDRAAPFLVSYGSDWSDADHHEYSYEIEQAVVGLSSGLRLELFQWVNTVCLREPTCRLLVVEPHAAFITFNYTNTLQRYYGICEAQVLHIHGSIREGAKSLILGHGTARTSKTTDPEEMDVIDPREAAGQDHLERYYEDTLKPVAAAIRRNRHQFEALSDVSTVYVWGHSLSEVDIPYFQEIVRATCSPFWNVSYGNEHECVSHRRKLEALGVPPARMVVRRLDSWSRHRTPPNREE